MAKKSKGTIRSMGERTVTVTLTFSVKPDRNINDNVWKSIEEQVDGFVESVDANTALTGPVQYSATYNRTVEVREPYIYQ